MYYRSGGMFGISPNFYPHRDLWIDWVVFSLCRSAYGQLALKTIEPKVAPFGLQLGPIDVRQKNIPQIRAVVPEGLVVPERELVGILRVAILEISVFKSGVLRIIWQGGTLRCFRHTLDPLPAVISADRFRHQIAIT